METKCLHKINLHSALRFESKSSSDEAIKYIIGHCVYLLKRGISYCVWFYETARGEAERLTEEFGSLVLSRAANWCKLICLVILQMQNGLSLDFYEINYPALSEQRLKIYISKV